MKKILITGADSYIGTSVEKWLGRPEFSGMYQVDTVDMRGDGWKEKDFSGYDAVFHVAGIAHADIRKVTEAALLRSELRSGGGDGQKGKNGRSKAVHIYELHHCIWRRDVGEKETGDHQGYETVAF